MIQAIKKLFTRDRSVELRMLDVIERQQEFIRANINERVVYLDKEVGYTNIDRFEEPKKAEAEEEEFEMPQDMTAEMLAEEIEGTKPEEGKK